MNEKRPLINDTPGQLAHPMTDKQYAEYLKEQEEVEKILALSHDSIEQRMQDLEVESKEIKAMLKKLTEA